MYVSYICTTVLKKLIPAHTYQSCTCPLHSASANCVQSELQSATCVLPERVIKPETLCHISSARWVIRSTCDCLLHHAHHVGDK